MQKFWVSKFSFSYIFFLSICAFLTLDLSLYSEQMDELQSSGHEATSNHDLFIHGNTTHAHFCCPSPILQSTFN